ncbi:MAG: response regulator [Desulfobacteraceae bacterium]|nr:MAG: response regulator [Desulfobacteraceae bacterium]
MSLNKRILFVDDEENILAIAVEYFKHKGYQVSTAANGVEAVKILESERIDCCFTDINMPQMDGLALAEHIRMKDNTIPVVVMTGYPSIENTIKTLKNGVVDFLIKPVSLNQMELCLQRVMREQQLFMENILLKGEVESKERLEGLNRELLEKVEELHILNKIMSDFTSIGTSIDVFKRATDLALEITRADETHFHVINEAFQKPFEIAAAGEEVEKKVLRQAEEGSTGSERRLLGGILRSFEKLIMETVSDEIPLLISENNGARGLSLEIQSLMIVPMRIRDKIFGVLTASIHRDGRRFNEKDLYYLSFLTQNAAHAVENLALYENIYENLFATLYAFVKALEARDAYTQRHSNRVTGLSLLIGKTYGVSSEDLDILNVAGRLHDIGKIGIRDEILLKPGKLTEEEFEKIKEHPVIGADIVGQLGLWDREQEIIRCHHERFDGSGYPSGLSADKIPLLSRILFVADSFDAMASDRAYRKRMPDEQVVQLIVQGSATQFDPQVVSVFLKLYREGKISRKWDEIQV